MKTWSDQLNCNESSQESEEVGFGSFPILCYIRSNGNWTRTRELRTKCKNREISRMLKLLRSKICCRMGWLCKCGQWIRNRKRYNRELAATVGISAASWETFRFSSGSPHHTRSLNVDKYDQGPVNIVLHQGTRDWQINQQIIELQRYFSKLSVWCGPFPEPVNF